MLRSRTIKPGIVWNVDLAKLGPMARLLFEGLLQMADREGRLVDEPERIHSQAFPYEGKIPGWEDYTLEAVKTLLDSLCKGGFISRFVGGKGVKKKGVYLPFPQGVVDVRQLATVPIIQVLKFAEHQHPHQREESSVLTPETFVSGGDDGTSDDTSHAGESWPNGAVKLRPRQGSSKDHPRQPRTRTSKEVFSTATSIQRTDRAQKLRSVGKPPAEKPPRKPTKPDIDWGFYQREDVDRLRQILTDVPRPRMGIPDDLLVRRVLDVCGGRSVDQILQALRALCVARRFDSMRSWGLLPTVLAGVFRTQEQTA